MTKVLYISHSSDIGGAARSLMFLVKEDPNAHVLVPSWGPILTEYRRYGISYDYLRLPVLYHSIYNDVHNESLNDFINRLIVDYPNIKKLERYINEGYTVFHLNEIIFAPLIPVLRYLFGNKIKIVTHVRLTMPCSHYMTRIFTYCLKKSDYLIGVVESVLDPFQSYSEKKVIYNPVDFGPYLPSYRRTEYLNDTYNIPRNKKIIGYFGMLHKGKGQDFLIEYLVKKKEKLDRECIIIFFGDGPMYRELLNKVTENELSKTIHFAGLIQNVYEAMEGCDFIVRTDETGDFGRDILEANSLGVPILISRKSTNRDDQLFKESYNGYGFLPGDFTEFDNKWNQMLLHYRELRGNTVRDQFGYTLSSGYYGKVKEIFDSL